MKEEIKELIQNKVLFRWAKINKALKKMVWVARNDGSIF